MTSLTFRIIRRGEHGDYAEGSPSLVKSGEAIKGVIEQIVGIEHGTTGGRPSVAFIIKLEDDRYVFAETTYLLFNTIANGLRAAHLSGADQT